MLFELILGLVVLILASIQDLKTREVADILSWGLVALGFLFAIVKTTINWNYEPILSSVIGFTFMFIIGSAFYYTGQWGGGDAKIGMGLGSLIGLYFGNYFLIMFVVLMLFAGSIYGLIYSLALAFMNYKQFKKKFLELIRREKIHRNRSIIIYTGIVLLVISIFAPIMWKMALILLVAVSYITFYLYVFVKAVESSLLIKKYYVNKLTEGDWVNEEIKIGKKTICSPKDLGVTLEQIALLKKHKIKSVMVKEGIPFIPSFLIAYIAAWILIHLGFSLTTIFNI